MRIKKSLGSKPLGWILNTLLWERISLPHKIGTHLMCELYLHLKSTALELSQMILSGQETKQPVCLKLPYSSCYFKLQRCLFVCQCRGWFLRRRQTPPFSTEWQWWFCSTSRRLPTWPKRALLISLVLMGLRECFVTLLWIILNRRLSVKWDTVKYLVKLWLNFK